MLTTPIFYEKPEGEPLLLALPPRLASWNRADHPDQLALGAFLDHSSSLVKPQIATRTEPLAVRLDVGLAPELDLLKNRDLDNYLFPLVTRLASKAGGRFVSAWGTKRVGETSYLRVGPARPRSVTASPTLVRTTRSSETSAFKQEIFDQLLGAKPLPDGPVALEIGFVVGPRRAWPNLWKPTIDALGALLGTNSPRPWQPNDGRIVELGLHVRVDQSLEYDTVIGLLPRSLRTSLA